MAGNDLDKDRCSTTSQDPSAPSVEGLIARLEAASEGSEELDEAVTAAVGGFVYPCCTRSVDDALTLITHPHYLGSIVRAYAVNDEPMWICVLVGPEGGGFPAGNWRDNRIEASAPTIALSICAAALHARAASSPIVG